MSLFVVNSVLILDADGKRIVAQYFNDTFPTKAAQLKYEKDLFAKTSRANSEILLFEGQVTVYRGGSDVFFYVSGGQEENELVLSHVLGVLYDSLAQMLRNQVDKRTLQDNMEIVLLTLDEIFDDGIILESDSAVVVQRVSLRGAEGEPSLAEQTFSQALQSAKEQIAKSLLKG
eukprot:TRINITY_DN2925_c0_g1_i1.p2 TRINITY_DN2925_c0_g1~~TRINITY_DN2925_c0_g1_i1.p2  ORF type:complete len:182 (-),score=62.58 TRINITY_DN2925_c0_g1_i1:23-544(-)